jgi:outer membrane protein W
MKKLLFSVAMLAAGVAAYAQKPASGDITLETQLNLRFSDNPIGMTVPNIRARYFLNEGLAARAQFLFTRNSTTTNFAENADGTGGKGSVVSSNSTFQLGLGVEKHFAGTDKLSPYVGALLIFGMDGASEEWDKSDGNGYDADTKATITNGNSDGDRAATGFGLQLLAGADYYITDGIYIGGEFGWGFLSASVSDEETKVTVAGTETKTVNLGGSGSTFDLTANGGIRLGIKF